MPLALLYHAVFPLMPRITGEQRTLVVDPAELGWQLAELSRRGFRSLTLQEFHAAVVAEEEDDRLVLLTFDDAYAHIFDAVTPLLGEHGQVATVFVPSDHLGIVNDWDGEELPVRGLAVADGPALRASGSIRASGKSGRTGSGTSTCALCRRRRSRRDLGQARRELSALAGDPGPRPRLPLTVAPTPPCARAPGEPVTGWPSPPLSRRPPISTRSRASPSAARKAGGRSRQARQ